MAQKVTLEPKLPEEDMPLGHFPTGSVVIVTVLPLNTDDLVGQPAVVGSGVALFPGTGQWASSLNGWRGRALRKGEKVIIENV